MGRELVAMRVRMGMVPRREHGFCLGMMDVARMGGILVAMLFLFDVPLLVLAGTGSEMFHRIGYTWRFMG